MTTDDTREALTAMVREGEAAGMYATTDHGAAGFCTDHAQVPARDALTEVAYRAWCDARKGKPEAPGEYEALYSRIEAGWMAQVVAAVVAALDDETARLRAQVVRVRDHDDRMTVQWHEAMHDLAAARAALDRVRAVDEDVLLGQVLRWQREQGLTPDADDDRYAVRAALVFIRAALDSEVTS